LGGNSEHPELPHFPATRESIPEIHDSTTTRGQKMGVATPATIRGFGCLDCSAREFRAR
jgi:hypothetical protein